MLFEYIQGQPEDILDKEELEIGKTYKGYCRNTEEAVWNGEAFEYTNWFFNKKFIDIIEHPADCKENLDVFMPLRKLN